MSEPVSQLPLLDSPSPDILDDSPVCVVVLEPPGPPMEENRLFTDFRVSSTRLRCSATGVLNGDGRVDLPVESLEVNVIEFCFSLCIFSHSSLWCCRKWFTKDCDESE
jgi:hypothetical protein